MQTQQVREENFKNTVETINNYFKKAEDNNYLAVLETCLDLASCFIYGFFFDFYYEKVITELDNFIRKENEVIYFPANLQIFNPLRDGLRVIRC
jgi:hypothetical protein